jgi:hypothetical protein
VDAADGAPIVLPTKKLPLPTDHVLWHIIKLFQPHPARQQTQSWPRRQQADGLRLAPHLHLHAHMRVADMYQMAKNCRASVEMIEKRGAAHFKNGLGDAAMNVIRPK